MSVWIRGTLEGSYVGTRAPLKRSGPLADLVPYDIRLYRATIAAVEPIAPPVADTPPPKLKLPAFPTLPPPPLDDDTTHHDATDDGDAPGGAPDKDVASGAGEQDPQAAATTADAPAPSAQTAPATSRARTDTAPPPPVSPTPARARTDTAPPPPVSPTPAAGSHPALSPTLPPGAQGRAPGHSNQLRQAELHDVNYVGVGAADLAEHHAAYDLRLENVELTSSIEIDGRIYGRLSADVVASLFPTDAMKAQAARERVEQRKREKRTGAWVEAIRWVLILGGAWLTFGLCGTVACLLWLGVTLFSAVTRALLRNLVPATPAVRVLGWALVLTAGGLSWLLYHRVTTVQCASANWWLLGIAIIVVVSSLLYSRFAFLWTKVIWLGTLLSLCWASRTHHCAAKEPRPSVVDQPPRTEPDGHWPKAPDVSPPALDGLESRQAAVRVSVPQAILERDALWNAQVPVVIYVPLVRVFDPSGAVNPSSEMLELAELLKKPTGKTVLLEVHGGDSEDTDGLARAASEWLVRQGVSPTRVVARGLGAKYPLLPTDGLGGDVDANRRLEVLIPR